MITVSLTKSTVAAVAAGGLLVTGIAVAAASPAPTDEISTASVSSTASPSSTASASASTTASGTAQTGEPEESTDTDDSAAEGTHAPNPASTLKGDNGWIHSEGRNSVGASRRDGLPKPSSSKTHSPDDADDSDDTESDEPGTQARPTSQAQRTSADKGKRH